MKILFLILIISFSSFAKNEAPESIIRSMIAGEQVPGKECKDAPEEKCISFEGKDVAICDLIDGELIENPDKIFSRDLSEKKRKDAELVKAASKIAKKEAAKNADIDKAKTIADLKVILKLMQDALKEE